MWLIALDDTQLQSGLGLTLDDIAVLRGSTPPTPALSGASHQRVVGHQSFFRAPLHVGLSEGHVYH